MLPAVTSRVPVNGGISDDSIGDALPSLPPTITLDPADLADHPLLAHIPVWPKDSEEFKSLRESLRADGQLYEVLIDHQRRVVDGRNRRNALAALGRPVVCRPVADGEVATIVFRTLMQRRHVTKGARAFLAIPLVQPLIEAAKARRFACLRRGAETPVSASSGNGVPSVDRIALDVGVSRDEFDRALRLHELLAKAPAEVRNDITARVLSGELGLGYACTAVTNYAEAGGRAEKLGKRQEHDRLFTTALPRLSLHWEQANPTQREQIRENLRSSVATWPVELLQETKAAVAAALKRAGS
jgi:hypothetical protein